MTQTRSRWPVERSVEVGLRMSRSGWVRYMCTDRARVGSRADGRGPKIFSGAPSTSRMVQSCLRVVVAQVDEDHAQAEQDVGSSDERNTSRTFVIVDAGLED